MNFIEWELSRGAEIDEDITTSYNLNRTCFYSLQGYNVYLIHGKSSSTIYVRMQIYLVLKLLRVLTQYGQIRSPGPTLWRCFRCLLLGAESASIQNDLYVFQDVSLGFFNFSLLKVTLWPLKNLFKIFTRRTFKQTVSTLTLGCFSAVLRTLHNSLHTHPAGKVWPAAGAWKSQLYAGA